MTLTLHQFGTAVEWQCKCGYTNGETELTEHNGHAEKICGGCRKPRTLAVGIGSLEDADR